MGREDGAEGFEVVFVDGFPFLTFVEGDGADEFEVAVAPFLGDVAPLFVGLGRQGLVFDCGCAWRVDQWRSTMSVAVMRILVAMEDVASFNAALVAFHSVSVTVFRQSTHVPKTSKKRAFGLIVEVMLM